MVTAEQYRAARAMLALKVIEVAEKAGVSKNTVVRLEAGKGGHNATHRAVCSVYESAGIQFIEDGVIFKSPSSEA